MKAFRVMLACLPLVMGSMQLQAQEAGDELPTVNELQQEAISLQQSILTATRNERDELTAEADRVLTRFDRRITALRENIIDRRGEMSAAAVRYADDLLTTMRQQRERVEGYLDQVRESVQDDAGNAWDRAVYNFSSTYSSFIETWEDVEANVPTD